MNGFISTEKLTAEQAQIINLKHNSNYVIQGGPGTGKTVIAVLRAAQLSKDGETLILVFNRPLMLYLEKIINEMKLQNCNVKTYFSWLAEVYREKIFKNIPNINGEEFNTDFNTVIKDFMEYNKKLYKQVVIDEGQDFPIDLFTAISHISENITCFIDPNQAIENHKTAVNDVLDVLEVESPRTLNKNFRNTKEINDLARLFWNNKGVFPESVKEGVKPVLVKCCSFGDKDIKVAQLIKANKGKDIGVFVNNKRDGWATYQSILKSVGNEVNVQYWFSSKNQILDFSKKGVKIFTYGTIKGLEFDSVIIGWGEKIQASDSEFADKNKLYVALTRSKENLYICYFNENDKKDSYIDLFTSIQSNKNICEWK